MINEPDDRVAHRPNSPMISWQAATVTAVKHETPDVKTYMLKPDEWRPFRAGQHIDVRLTAPDGYQAQRSYSIASAPERVGCIDITIEHLEDGEVSPYFHHVVETGDQIEIRGPIGGPFTWKASENDRLLLVAGGSGIVPIMSMLRHRAASGMAKKAPATLIYSSRTFQHIIYRGELGDLEAADPHFSLLHTLTRSHPPGWRGGTSRVGLEMLRDGLDRLNETDCSTDRRTMCFICGPSDFVENSALYAVDLGISPENIRTERFGPTGT